MFQVQIVIMFHLILYHRIDAKHQEKQYFFFCDGLPIERSFTTIFKHERNRKFKNCFNLNQFFFSQKNMWYMFLHVHIQIVKINAALVFTWC